MKWKNWSGNVKFQFPNLVIVREEADIIKAINSSLKVRVAGSGHSFTNVVKTEETLLNMDEYNKVVQIDKESMKVTVQAGIKLYQLNDILNREGLALENLGDIDKQSLAGALLTGTHGTGKGFGILSTMVTNLRIVNGSGEVEELEGNSDDSKFKAALVSLGSLGIVSEITLKVVEKFTLHYRSRVTTLEKVKNELESLITENTHFEMYWFPFTDNVQLKISNHSDESPDSSRIKDFINDIILENYLFGGLCFITWLLPFTNNLIAKIVGNSISELKKTDNSPRIFTTPRNVRFNEMEFSLPVSNGYNTLIKIKEMIVKKKHKVLFPVEFRYVKGDKFLLSPAYGEDRIYIAVHKYHRRNYEKYFHDCQEIFFEMGGRPHWGKMHYLHAENLKQLYPEWDRFCQIRKEMDPHDKFLSEYLRKLFLS